MRGEKDKLGGFFKKQLTREAIPYLLRKAFALYYSRRLFTNKHTESKNSKGHLTKGQQTYTTFDKHA